VLSLWAASVAARSGAVGAGLAMLLVTFGMIVADGVRRRQASVPTTYVV
jgi:hypothetical protein